MSTGDRTAEIWSTRLQRELLALTSSEKLPEEENDDEAVKDSEGTKSHRSANNNDVGVLPRFVTVKDHSLDIVKATCEVTFQIAIISSSSNNKEKNSSSIKECEDPFQQEQVPEPDTVESETSGERTSQEEKVVDKEETSEQVLSEQDEKEEITMEKDQDANNENQNNTDDPIYVLVTLDASMKHNSKGEILSNASAYPFEKPKATLQSGAQHFSPGSDIQNGDELEVTCDWTPSLHLSDAAMNLSLTIRETILRGEPYFKVVKRPKKTREELTIDALLRKFSISTSSSQLSKKKAPKQSSSKPKPQRSIDDELQVGDVIDLNETPYNMCAGMYSCKAIRRPQFMETAIAEHAASQMNKLAPESEEDSFDENEVPQGIGNYMKLQAGGIRKVAGSGIQGTKSMFKSFLTSAKSAMEDSFLMITDSYIVELRSSKFNIGTATVTYATSVSLLAKLKFRRQESISLFFKQAPDDPLIFMCPDSADAVQQIQNVLKRHGVKGKHTNTATQRAIQSALQLVVEIQALEQEVEQGSPTVEHVDKIMSLSRQAAERFESAGDVRHKEVMDHMRNFLKTPKVVALLDGGGGASRSSTMDNTQTSLSSSKTTPEGEILQPIPDEEDFEHDLKKHEDAMKASQENADDFNVDDDLDNFLAQNTSATMSPEKDDANDHDRDPVAELDAMFSAADKELTDILNS